MACLKYISGTKLSRANKNLFTISFILYKISPNREIVITVAFNYNLFNNPFACYFFTLFFTGLGRGEGNGWSVK